MDAMELQHVNVKIFVEGALAVEPACFIDVFHTWIRDKVLPELLVDVADYRHVPAGPGVMLVALEADCSMDNTGDRYGLRYNRKATAEGSNEDRLAQALSSAANACGLLEEHFATQGPLKFSRTEFELSINDRALAPNAADTLAACKPELEAFLEKALGHRDFKMIHDDDPRHLFSLTVKVDKPFDLASLASLPVSKT